MEGAPALQGAPGPFLSGFSRKAGFRVPRQFPFNLPLIQKSKSLDLNAKAVFFVGDNGSGKSTLLEGLAAALGFPSLGSQDLSRDPSLAHARLLAGSLRLSRARIPKNGFFFRAEDYFGYVKRLAFEMEALKETEEDFGARLKGYGRRLAMGSARGQRAALENRYGGDPDARSHGEGFLHMIQARLRPGGLYLMDEPEAPLSPLRQLALLGILKEMLLKDCQFIIATHSPILTALPGARILDFNSVPPSPISWEEAGQVRLLKAFLNNPASYADKA
jgi:predicted ATPase